MKEYNDILADCLNCEKEGIADKLFPINKGFTEKERIEFVNAIYNAMYIVNQNVPVLGRKSDSKPDKREFDSHRVH